MGSVIGAALKVGARRDRASTVLVMAVSTRGSSGTIGWRAMGDWSMPTEMSFRGTFWGE